MLKKDKMVCCQTGKEKLYACKHCGMEFDKQVSAFV